VQYGQKKYASIRTDDPYLVDLERALEVIREKETTDANRLIRDFPEAGIQVLNGRFGPYITDRVKNAKIPKDREPISLTLEECQVLIAAAPARGGRFGRGARGARGGPAAKKSASGAAAKKAAKVTEPPSLDAARKAKAKTTTTRTRAKKSAAKKSSSKAKATGSKVAAAKVAGAGRK
jgi:DNA topoisomerase-1